MLPNKGATAPLVPFTVYLLLNSKFYIRIQDKFKWRRKIINLNNLLYLSAKIGIFYAVFYGILAALVAICMWVFFQTLDPRIPKWTLNKSIIGTNPGKYRAHLYLHGIILCIIDSHFPQLCESFLTLYLFSLF